MSYTQEKVDEALALVDAGKSHSEAGRILKIPQVNISRWVRKRHTKNGDTPVNLPDTDPTPPPNVPQKIALASLCLDPDTQMRVGSDLAVAAEYAEAMRQGATFPPITVFSDGVTFWLADGYQRLGAAKQLEQQDISAEIRPGGLRDAILYACGANSQHGLQRSNGDKRKAVRTLLDDEEWSHWSDRKIADVCRVSHTLVSELRAKLTGNSASDDSNTRQYVDKHGNISTMDTSNIGRRATGTHKTPQEPERSPVEQPTIVEDEPP